MKSENRIHRRHYSEHDRNVLTALAQIYPRSDPNRIKHCSGQSDRFAFCQTQSQVIRCAIAHTDWIIVRSTSATWLRARRHMSYRLILPNGNLDFKKTSLANEYLNGIRSTANRVLHSAPETWTFINTQWTYLWGIETRWTLESSKLDRMCELCPFCSPGRCKPVLLNIVLVRSGETGADLQLKINKNYSTTGTFVPPYDKDDREL